MNSAAGDSATTAYKIVQYTSLGESAIGHLYLPVDGTVKCPGVISAPGFGGVKEMMLPDFCKVFVKAGIACLIVDPIGFGESTGKLRQNVAPEEQLRTIRDGISFLQQQPEIDPARIGVWGPSLCGGHTLVIAGTDPRVKAGVAITPHVSVIGAAPARIDLGLPIATDGFGRLFGRDHATIPAAGVEGSKAVMNTDGALDWIKEKTKGCEHFRNEVTVASIVNMLRYNTGPAAAQIKIPLLAITALDDTITPAKNIHKALAGVKSAEIKDFEGSHFGLFGEHYQEVIDLTIAFMSKHL